MLHSLAERIAVFLFDKTDDYPLEIYTYGLELIISSIVETFVLVLLGVLLNSPIETIVFILSFSFLRFFTGGYHAKSYLKCAVVTVIIYLFVIISYEFFKTFSFSCQIGLTVVIFLISFVLIGLFAPIENANKRLVNKQKYKHISFVILALELVLTVIEHLVESSYLFVILPTVFSVDVLMMPEIIRKRGDKVE